MKYWFKRLMSIFIVLSLCTGCGTSGGSTEEGTRIEGNAEQNPVDADLEENPDRALRVGEIIHIPIEDPDGEFTAKDIYSGSFDGKLFLLSTYRSEDSGQPAMWLYTFDINTQETVKSSFSLEIPNMESFFVDSMIVTDENELTFRLYGSSEGSDTYSGFLCRTELTGKLLDEIEPFSEDMEYLPVSGRFFAVSDGLPFLVEGESTSTHLSRYDTESQETVPLTVVDCFIYALCSDGQGGLYYVGDAELKHLYLDSLDEVSLCSTADCGIMLSANNCLLLGKEGELAVCTVSASDPTVYLLTDQGETAEREDIRLVNINPHYEPTQELGLAASWSLSSGNYRITTEKTTITSQAMDALRDRTMAELAAGNGPEIMFVSEDDLHVLTEKGALTDLSELIDEDIREQILPSVLQLCTIDDVWVGIPANVYFYTMMTSDSLWTEDSWQVSDILDLAENRDGWEDWVLSEITLWDRVSGLPMTPPDSSKLFEIGFLKSLGDSPFMDMENGISYFNSEEFIRVMEFCKKYGYTGNITADMDSVISMLEEGNTLAQFVDLYFGMQDFSREMASHENCHMVGFPSESGSGNYVYSEGYFVVNANAVHKEGIKEFLNYLFSYDIQHSSYTPIRKDVLRDRVTVHPQTGEPAVLLHPSNKDDPFSYQELDTKPDGTSYLEEFMDFVESCEPIPYCSTVITEVVQEELDAYFAGDRSAKDTADIIHRRVQLYFDENQ